MDIWKWKTPKSGVAYSGEVEMRLAAAWANYTWEGFCLLSVEDMTAHVAAYRLDGQISAVLAMDARRKQRSAK